MGTSGLNSFRNNTDVSTMNPNTPRLGGGGGANAFMSRDIDHTLHVRMDS